MKKIFTILAVSAIALVSAQTNLVQNPGFESGLAPWAAGTVSTYTVPTISTTDFHSGAQAAVYVLPTSTTGFYQNIAIEGNTDYVLTFWYKASTNRAPGSSQNNIFRLWSIMKNAADAAVYTTATSTDDPLRTNNSYLPLSATWVQHTVSFKSHADAVSLDLGFRSYGDGSSSVDDVSLVKGTLAVVDVKEFDKQVKMNTVVDNELTLRLPERSTVNIYSVDGKLVSSNRVSDGSSISTAGMTKGNYIVTVDNGSAKISRKIIKK